MMKKVNKNIFMIVFFFVVVGYVSGQKITLDKIYSGYYKEKHISGITSMKNGESYTLIQPDGIVQFSYKNSQKERYIAQGSFESYEFSEDESKILLLRKRRFIYRHSFLGEFDVKDLQTQKTVRLNNGKPVQEPRFSPDATKVAFISENNLFYQELSSGKIIQITQDGKKNHILNGLADWVYEEEFGHVRLYEWTKNSDAIVFVKLNESEVPEINIQMYRKNLYPQDFRFKYPKAGEKNSEASVYLYRLNTGSITGLNLSSFKNYYIPNVIRTAKPNEIVLITSGRIQNASDILKVNTVDGSVKKLFTETDEKWIETDHVILEFLSDNSFIWGSERDGNRHLYWYNEDGKLIKQITKGKWDVLKYYGYHPESREIYIQTNQTGSINRVVAKVSIQTGKNTVLSAKEGNNSGNFSKNYQYFIEVSSSAQKPNTYTLKNRSGDVMRFLESNDEVLDKLKLDKWVAKEYFIIPNQAGDKMNAWIMKPKNFDSNKKYPLFMYQYSGPASQQVTNSWDGSNGLWFNHLVQHGYIVVAVDGRGTGGKGTAYKKSTYMNLGKYETEDQISAAKWLSKLSYIDENRIGIFGWSFGGYVAGLAITKGADIFKVGIAVAPVTNWRYYDTIYTERFMRTPQENASGYDENSPINFAHLLKGKFLMIHGTADDNVHYQNAADFANTLIENKKQFHFMVYPDKNHGIYGGNTRLHLYQLMTNFIIENL